MGSDVNGVARLAPWTGGEPRGARRQEAKRPWERRSLGAEAAGAAGVPEAAPLAAQQRQRDAILSELAALMASSPFEPAAPSG